MYRKRSKSGEAGSSSAKECENEEFEVDNSDSVVMKIATLYADKLMSDISLVVDGTHYPAHRLILCASSEVFQVMLMNPEWSECREGIIQLQEDPKCAVVFSHFLKYLYTGKLNITFENAMPILVLADKYNVKDLVGLCIKYMKDNIVSAAHKGFLISWLQYTNTCQHKIVANACLEFIKWNFQMLTNCQDFGLLEPELLAYFLQQNDLVVKSETVLFNYVVKWIELQRARLCLENISDDIRSSAFEEMITHVSLHIRFPMMSPRELAELLLIPLTMQYKEFFVNRIAIGMSYHSGQKDRIVELFRDDDSKMLFTPRLYTDDNWSSTVKFKDYCGIKDFQTTTCVFTTMTTLGEHKGDRTCQWIIDVSPKGVWFKKSQLIVWQASMEVPEIIMKTVRVAITCHDPPQNYQDLRMKVGIIITGFSANVEHVMYVKEKIYHFSIVNKTLNMDDLIPYDNLNCYQNKKPQYFNNPYLVGDQRDTLKLIVVIVPLDSYCTIESPKMCC